MKVSRQIVFVSSLVLCVACDRKTEKKYYPEGQIRYEVPLVSNARHGKMVMYYQDGRISRVSNWSRGKLEGETILYYPDERIMQVQEYKNGILCCHAFFYRNDGSLQEKQYFNEKGKKVDYEKYNPDGTRNFDFSLTKAVIASESDTVRLGEYFRCEIRLGNRRFGNTEVLLGDFEGKLIEGIKQPKKDSITSIVEVETKVLGKNILKGIILEFDENQSDSTLVIPFQYSFYVISS